MEPQNHKTIFCLCVDNLGVNYFNKYDTDHLLESLKNHYAISTDWEGHNYLGLTTYCIYNEEYMDTPMPEYVEKVLDWLQHTNPKIPQYSPHHWTVPGHGKILLMAPNPDGRNIIDKEINNRIQSVDGTILYYARSVDQTMLRAINEILWVQ